MNIGRFNRSSKFRLDDLTAICPKCGYNLTGLKEHRCPECGEPFDPIALLREQLERPTIRKLSTSSLVGSIFASVCAVLVAIELGGPPGLLVLVTLFLLWLMYVGRRGEVPVSNASQAGRPGKIMDRVALLLVSLTIVIGVICVAIWWLFLRHPFKFPFL